MPSSAELQQQALEKFLRMKDLILPPHRYTIITAHVLCITLTRQRIDMGRSARCHPQQPRSQWTLSGQTQEFYIVAGVLINSISPNFPFNSVLSNSQI
jgi:hypothetical protein